MEIIPRKWPLLSTSKETNEDPKECNAQKFRYPNCTKIKAYSSKQIYSGDRFLPCRRGYDFEMAHYLLMKHRDDDTPTHIIDVFKQIALLDTTYRRKALRAIMIEQVLIPDQDKILHFSSSMVRRPRESPRPEYEKKESWKCIPRKRPLMGSAEKMLSLPGNDNVKAIDWSCNDMMAIYNDLLNIYDENGEKVLSKSFHVSRHDSIFPDNVNQIDIKWASDGNKLIMSFFTHRYITRLIMYDWRKEKILWNIVYKCDSNERGCFMRCIWSAYDHQIVIGCADRISIFNSNTGKLLSYTKLEETRSEILTFSFSPNFKYLVSTAKDKVVRFFSWPELIACFSITFFKPIKAVAWHPQVSDLLCIGGGKHGSLSLWNVNKCTMTAFVRAKFSGRVENLAWNKLNGELIVHWIYKKRDNVYTIVAVLASFDRIVDVLPLNKETRFCFLKFNAAHEQLITFCSDTNVYSIWNFFGNEKLFQGRHMPHDSSAQRKQGVIVHNPIR